MKGILRILTRKTDRANKDLREIYDLQRDARAGLMSLLDIDAALKETRNALSSVAAADTERFRKDA